MNKVNLIFIDIDGVLNSEHFYEYTDNYTWDMFDPASVHLLNKLIEETNSMLVLSSDWRKTYGVYEVKKIFKQNKIKGIIVGCTPTILNPNRGLEIQLYLKHLSKKNEINYVILDDDPNLKISIQNEQIEHFVQINPEFGLCFKDYEKASKILEQ